MRLNALRHGLRARGILLPGENPEEYTRLCQDLESDWQPHNRTEQLLVEQMAVAQWKLARLEIGERSIFEKDLPAERQLSLLDRFSVYRGRLERSFSRAMREIEHLRKTQSVAEARPARDKKRQNATLLRNSPPPAYIMAEQSAGPYPAVAPAMVMSPAQPDSR